MGRIEQPRGTKGSLMWIQHIIKWINSWIKSCLDYKDVDLIPITIIS